MNRAIHCKGFTLVELLVVTGLIASLLSVVIVAMRPTAESQVRELARNIQSALMQAQTRSLTNARGACLVLVPSSTVSCGAAYFAEPRPIISTQMKAPDGATLEQILTTGAPNLFNTGSASAAFITPVNADLPALEAGYRVRLSTGATYGPWYNFSFTAYDSSGMAAIALLTRPGSALDPATNIWPLVSGSQVPCQVVRYPEKVRSAVIAPKLASIDLRYSGLGDQPSPGSFDASSTSPIYWYSSLQSVDATSPDSICLDFNRTGVLDGIFRITPFPGKRWADAVTPNAPVYLLVATNDDIAANRSLQSTISTWIAINPKTGAVTAGKNNPTALPSTAGLGKEDLERVYADWFRTLRTNVR
jgi:prepilin-type N-terminal cleavage/methylation domain-containing protein